MNKKLKKLIFNSCHEIKILVDFSVLLKDTLHLSALHGNNACTRNLGDRLRGCWQRKEWILSFLSLHIQRVLIHKNSSKIFDIDCCVPHYKVAARGRFFNSNVCILDLQRR